MVWCMQHSWNKFVNWLVVFTLRANGFNLAKCQHYTRCHHVTYTVWCQTMKSIRICFNVQFTFLFEVALTRWLPENPIPWKRSTYCCFLTCSRQLIKWQLTSNWSFYFNWINFCPFSPRTTFSRVILWNLLLSIYTFRSLFQQKKKKRVSLKCVSFNHKRIKHFHMIAW